MGLLDGDLRRSIYAGFKGKLLSGRVRRLVVPTSGGLDDQGDPIAPAPVYFTIEGFTDRYSAFYRAQAGIPETDLKVCILAGSNDDYRPSKDDQVLLRGTWYQMRDWLTDPAEALWECQSYEIEAPQ